jgi:methionine-rich copper-binding protein CopC
MASALTIGTVVVGGGSSVGAHDGIASSSPASGSTIAQPIDVVTIDFGAEIGDDVELALLGPDDAALASTTTKTSSTTAKIEFDSLPRKGTYFVQYLAPSISDGHLFVGAISFTYGTEPGGSIGVWVAFGLAAVVILGIGVWFSRRAHLRVRAQTATVPDLTT